MTRGHQQTPNSSGLRLLPVFFCCSLVLALGMAAMPVSDWGADDGLALPPPMGWNSWNHYRLNVSDVLIRKQAEAIVKSGMKAAGYEYVVIDGG